MNRIQQDRKNIALPDIEAVPFQSRNLVVGRSVANRTYINKMIVIGKPDGGLNICIRFTPIYRETYPEIASKISSLPGIFFQFTIDKNLICSSSYLQFIVP